MKTENGLSVRRQRFVLEYLRDFNATQAAIRAGYSAKDADVQGPRLLGSVGVREAIGVAMESFRSEAIADSKECLEFWSAVMRDPTMDIGARLRASAMLGKALGDFCQKTVVEIRNDLLSVPRMELDERIALIKPIPVGCDSNGDWMK